MTPKNFLTKGTMGAAKNEFPSTFNWQTTNPAPFRPNTPPSGLTAGSMSGTNTIYSNIVDISIYDNMGLEVTWTGTPTGTFSVMVSNSGSTFYALTFNPTLAQPAGSAGGYAVNLNQLPFQYLMLEYTNSSGTGSLNVYGQTKAMV